MGCPVVIDGRYATEGKQDMINCTKFFKLINQIETGESHTSRNWNPINREARFCERTKAYEKMFYQFLDDKGFA